VPISQFNLDLSGERWLFHDDILFWWRLNY
jgi:hypothetical protein